MDTGFFISPFHIILIIFLFLGVLFIPRRFYLMFLVLVFVIFLYYGFNYFSHPKTGSNREWDNDIDSGIRENIISLII